METEKVEIVLDEREFSALMQLVFLGNYVANSIRDEDHKSGNIRHWTKS